MKIVTYAGGEYLTGDEIAESLMEYSEILGSLGDAQRVTIPIREADGTDGTAEFLVGPASQLVVKSVHVEGGELVDQETVDGLRARTARMKRTTAGGVTHTDFWI